MSIKKSTKDNYKTLIPKRLHKEVENLLAYLESFPFEQPTYCHFCEAKTIYFLGKFSRPDHQVPQYQCAACKRGFNQLTNTIFAQMWHLEKWGNVGTLFLAGLSTQLIANITGISNTAVLNRCKAINHLMQEQYPKLYQWWYKHYQRDDLTFSDIVQQQATFFLQWLDERINKKDYLCPECNQAMSKSGKDDNHRPLFVCYRCRIYHNALGGTRLKGLTQIELWIPFVEKIIEGYSSQDIAKLTPVKSKTALRWRPVFLAQMQDLGLNQLVQWLTWQRKRRYSQVVKISHSLSNLSKNSY